MADENKLFCEDRQMFAWDEVLELITMSCLQDSLTFQNENRGLNIRSGNFVAFNAVRISLSSTST